MTEAFALGDLIWPDLTTVVVRAISIGLVLEASGLAFFYFGLSPGLRDPVNERRAVWLAGAAAVLTVIQHVVTPARLAANFSGILDASLQLFYLSTDAGTAAIVRLFGMLLVLAGFKLQRRSLALGGGLLACMSFALMGHTVTHGERWLLAPLLLVHVTIIAFWFGSLAPLRRFKDTTSVTTVLATFSRAAIKAVPVLFVAGLGLALMLIPSWAALVDPYGLMILAKIGGFSVLIGMAAFNRWRLTPRIQVGDESALLMFRRVVNCEWLLIWLIIFVTVSVTSFYSPGS